ncbi:hypothetical protein [Caballeronia sordidicola]|uniref:hypothetical protein n=1 Tax=Caballeronia sordidicola TaxID=196367 RepID=UPI00117EB3E8|nr:hypothetical protein [Caballeronia sordidicola]
MNIEMQLFRLCLDEFLPVVDAKHSLCATDDELAQSNHDIALSLIAFYNAQLAAGWPEIRLIYPRRTVFILGPASTTSIAQVDVVVASSNRSDVSKELRALLMQDG